MSVRTICFDLYCAKLNGTNNFRYHFKSLVKFRCAAETFADAMEVLKVINNT